MAYPRDNDALTTTMHCDSSALRAYQPTVVGFKYGELERVLPVPQHSRSDCFTMSTAYRICDRLSSSNFIVSIDNFWNLLKDLCDLFPASVHSEPQNIILINLNIDLNNNNNLAIINGSNKLPTEPSRVLETDSSESGMKCLGNINIIIFIIKLIMGRNPKNANNFCL
jgi:hypothetical protein